MTSAGEVNHRQRNYRFPWVSLHMHVHAASRKRRQTRIAIVPKEFTYVRGCVANAQMPWNFKGM